jgi:hypothetical protein
MLGKAFPILLGRHDVAGLRAIGQFQGEQLAQQGRPFSERDFRQVRLKRRTRARLPGRLKPVAEAFVACRCAGEI